MKIRTFLIFLVLILNVNVNAQVRENERGVNVNEKKSTVERKIRAIIIGVSKFADKDMKASELKWADADAEFFYDFLKNVQGVDKKNLELFVNEETKSDSLFMIIRNRMYKSNSEDLIFVYLACHGVVNSNKLYFLCSDFEKKMDDGDLTASDGWISMNELIAYAGIAVFEKKAQVILIADACRTGEIFGSKDLHNTTVANLATESQTGVQKWVACGANQQAWEGRQYGGGHGAFTYFLVNGLKGLADIDPVDENITFYEISKYVQEGVRNATNQKQTPKLHNSNDDEVLFSVNPKMKQEAENMFVMYKDSIQNARGESGDRGFENYPTPKDSLKEKLLEKFKKALADNFYIQPKYYYERENNTIQIKKTSQEKIHINAINELKFSNNDKYLCSVSSDKTIGLKNMQTDKIKYLKRHKAFINSLDFSPDDKLLATGDAANSIYLWEAETGKYKLKFTNVHKKTVNHILFLDNNRFISSGDDGLIKIWNCKTKKIEKKIPMYKKEVREIATNSDRNILLISDKSGWVYLLNLSTYKIYDSTKVCNKEISKILLSQKENSFVTYAEEAEISVLDLQTLQKIKTIELKKNHYSRISIFGKYIFTFDKENNFYIYNYANNEFEKKKKIFDSKSKEILINHSGSKLVSNNGTSINITDVNFSPIKYPAFELLEQINNNDSLKNQYDDLKGNLYVSLANPSAKLSQDLTNASFETPKKDSIIRAIEYLLLAKTLYPDDYILSKKLTERELLLKSFLIITTYEVEQYDSAVNMLQEITKINPDASYPYDAMSIIYSRRNQLDKAKEAVLKAMQNSPRWTLPLEHLGNYFIKEKNYDEALKIYTKMTIVQPEMARGYNQLGDYWQLRGDLKESEKNYRKSIKNEPDNPIAYQKYGELQILRGQTIEGEKLIEKSNELSNGYFHSSLSLAEIFLNKFKNFSNKMEYLQEASKLYQAAYVENPNEPKVINSLANFYLFLLTRIDYSVCYDFLKNDNYIIPQDEKKSEIKKEEIINRTAKRILDLATRSKKMLPFDETAIMLCAFSNFYLDKSKGDIHFKEAIDKEPNNTKNYVSYAYYLSENNRFEEAEKNLKTAIQTDPNYLEAWIRLWDTYLISHKLQAIDELFKAAEKQFPNSPIFKYKYFQIKNNKKILESTLKSDSAYIKANIALNNLISIATGKIDNSLSEQYLGLKMEKIILKKYFIVSEKKKKGIMDISGLIIIPTSYDSIYFVNENNFLAVNYNFGHNIEAYWFDFSGNCTKIGYFNGLTVFSELIKIEFNDKFGAMDFTGKTVAECVYDDLYPFEEIPYIYCLKQNDNFGIMDKNGTIISPPKYSTIKVLINGNNYQKGNSYILECYDSIRKITDSYKINETSIKQE